MTSAAEIAKALDGRREKRQWRCRCPVHGGRSLALRDGRDGKLLVYCYAGCEWRDIFDWLRSRGLIGPANGFPSLEREEERYRREEREARAEVARLRRAISRARDLYRRGVDPHGTAVEIYLRSRGITGSIPPVLRFLEVCPHRNGRYYPAMVAPIVNVRGEQIAIHKTFLLCDGSGKADLPKNEQRETCGPMKGGGIRLAHPCLDTRLIVGEGIESTLSAMQMFGLPAWAAVCAGGIEALDLPAEIREVAIAADNDANGVGQCAGLTAHARWAADGRSVRIWLPPNVGNDFNDALLAGK